MTWNLQEQRGEPDHTQECKPDATLNVRDASRSVPEEKNGADEFDEHWRGDHPRSQGGMVLFIQGEVGSSRLGKKWVVHHLHEPDDARHEKCGRQLCQQQESWEGVHHE